LSKTTDVAIAVAYLAESINFNWDITRGPTTSQSETVN